GPLDAFVWTRRTRNVKPPAGRGGDGGRAGDGAVHRRGGADRRRQDGPCKATRHGVRVAAPPRARRGELVSPEILRRPGKVCVPDPSLLSARALPLANHARAVLLLL